jgi:hypothetical protein
MTDDVPVETASINILMHGEDEIPFKTIALGLAGPEMLISMTMDNDFELNFSIETGGIPFDETKPKEAYGELAQVLRLLADQLEGAVEQDDSL